MENPGCCDEIWFSTGIGAPSLEWHRERAKVIAEAVRDAKSAGISPSLQFQATLGHGDSFCTADNKGDDTNRTSQTNPVSVKLPMK